MTWRQNHFIKNFKPFIKYCVVGTSGTLIDIGSIYIFVELFSLPIMPAATLSFILAVTNNFIFNKTWTFKNPSKNFKKMYIKFFIISVIGLGITLLSMYLLVFILNLWYLLAKILTSGLVLTWNFLVNKQWTFRLSTKQLTATDNNIYDLSIIIPCYNEEKRIENTLYEIKAYLEQNKINAEVIVVDDGSTDKTKNIVKDFQEYLHNLHIVQLSKNSGKGFAVKEGVEKALGKYILFTDADNSTPIQELKKMMNNINNSNADIVIGSRYLKNGSNIIIKQPTYRIFLGRVGNFLIRNFLIDGIQDTQCGFKLFRSNVAKEIFSFQKVKRFGFDMEMLVVAKNLGYKILEVPVNWLNSPYSRLRSVRDSLITLKDLIYVKLNLWSGRYDRD